ncbi:uncharacterized protein LOC6731526 [Drosophila simulans]|uniref:GD23547 n=1 Tax=Drosophila simulans TaxID=7240 RepID=B4Q6V0_DROSI|nr:uncharacterized protein LOC6731526 [Drosophila simulans]EDX04259.1 GD23547 [Drosophila simulans]KMY89107.1 uncharacterized protein Dsimw501_GD23547 [Drosophila simulans]
MWLWELKVFLILWTVSQVYIPCWGKNLIGRFESINGIEGEEETLFTCSLRLVGRERMLNGSVMHQVDLDDSFEVWMDILHFKNGEWAHGNIKVRTKPCDWFTNYFGKYFLPLIKDSNLPPIQEMCVFPKGEYYLRNTKIEPQNWPPILYRGLNQFNINYVRDGKSTGGIQFVIDLEDKKL